MPVRSCRPRLVPRRSKLRLDVGQSTCGWFCRHNARLNVGRDALPRDGRTTQGCERQFGREGCACVARGN